MQIVIEIPEKRYKDIQRIAEVQLDMRTDTVEQIIANGTPLPKGHGRLIDADKLELDDGYSNYDGYYHKYSRSQIDNAPTIIEADTEGSESE